MAPGSRSGRGYSAAEDAIVDFTTKGPVAGPDPFKARLDVVEALASKRNQ